MPPPLQTSVRTAPTQPPPLRKHPLPQKQPAPHNRVQMLMVHTTRYAFEGQARLAQDAGVSRSTISRLISGQAAPSLRLAEAVTRALSIGLGAFPFHGRPVLPRRFLPRAFRLRPVRLPGLPAGSRLRPQGQPPSRVEGCPSRRLVALPSGDADRCLITAPFVLYPLVSHSALSRPSMPNTAQAAMNPASSQPDSTDLLRKELRRTLLALPYRAFLQIVLHLLQTQGYSSVRPAGRSLWKGHNRAGGWDAEAEVSGNPFGTLRCLVQAKQFDALPVQQRSVDELRGTCLRAGAQQGLLLTLSTFSPVAQKAAEAQTSLPVRLVDGDALLTLLLDTHIGVVRNSAGRWHLNAFYFQLLQDKFGQQQEISKPSSAKPVPQDAAPSRSRVVASRRNGTLTVTVTVDAPGKEDVQSLTSKP